MFQSTLATTLVGLGRFEEGVSLYKQVLDAHPDRHGLHLQTGHAL